MKSKQELNATEEATLKWLKEKGFKHYPSPQNDEKWERAWRNPILVGSKFKEELEKAFKKGGQMSGIVNLKFPNAVHYRQKSFWEKTEKLNRVELKKIGYTICFAFEQPDTAEPRLFFQNINDYEEMTPFLRFSEIDIINKQYRLLQEIYYKRLEVENDTHKTR